MLLNLLLIVLGIMLVLWGADRLTDGAVGVAQRAHVPQTVIGLTIVAMGTSMPEFCVSLVSALKGTTDMAVGNAMGSNIFNALLIVGAAALIAPIVVERTTVQRDMPFALIASAALLLMAADGNLSRIDCIILFCGFIYFVVATLRQTKTQEMPPESVSVMGTGRAILYIVLGLLGLIVGSNVFVDSATAVARQLNMSDAVIGLTIVAGGTSLPELATTVVAARKGNSGIAIGNVLGSNVFNILFVLGLTGIISPMAVNGITAVDFSLLIFSMSALWLFSFTKYRIERWEGAVLIAVFVGYMWHLLSA